MTPTHAPAKRGRPRKVAPLPREQRKLAAYIRVSTDKQDLSPEAQRDAAIAYCALQGWGIPEMYEDKGYSAKALNRPAMQRLLEEVRAGAVGRVIVMKLDRISRSVRDLCHLIDVFEAADVAFVSCRDNIDTKSSAGRLMVHVLASVAEWERDVISERTKEGLAVLKARGVKLGATALEDRGPAAARAVAAMRRLRNGGQSYRAISEALAADGMLSPKGRPYSVGTIHAVCERTA